MTSLAEQPEIGADGLPLCCFCGGGPPLADCACSCHDAAPPKPEPSHCRSCGAAVWFGRTKNGRLCPYNIGPDGEYTDAPHFVNCPQSQDWSKRGKR